MLRRLPPPSKGTNDLDSDLPETIDMDGLFNSDYRNDPAVLMGNRRWMRRGAGAIIVGQSGIGLSSFAMQLASSLALGRSFFGAPVTHPLRVLYIHADTEIGASARLMAGISEGMNLSEEDRKLLVGNLRIKRETATSGRSFLNRVEDLIQAHKPDVVIADPLVAYFGGDLCSQGATSAFLRNGGLSTLLDKTGVMWFWTHYTPKPKKGSKGIQEMNLQDYCFSGFGTADIPNWARAVIVLGKAGEYPVEDGESKPIFSVTLPKRGADAGFVDYHGQPVSERFYIRHAAQAIFWELSDCP